MTDAAPVQHVMLDLETFGTGPNALPISIGAVKFTLDKPVDGTTDAFHVGIMPSTAQAFGLTIDADTMMWWLDEERAEARRAWMALEKMDLPSVLAAFAMWMNDSNTRVWGNGAAFDNVILRAAYLKVLGEGTVPWKHWNDRCYRTMKGFTRSRAPDMSQFGCKHSALADAMAQAAHLQAICHELEIEL